MQQPSKLSQQLAETLSFEANDRLPRRSFLVRAAVAGASFSFAPATLFRRATAAQTCCTVGGKNCNCGSNCCDNWSIACCNIPGGSNQCPGGTAPSGFWRCFDSSCPNNYMHYIDCSVKQDSSVHACADGCRCSQMDCGNHRTCCFDTNTDGWPGLCDFPGGLGNAGKIRCRVITCTNPHDFNSACSSRGPDGLPCAGNC
jgi:hypothetical protein